MTNNKPQNFLSVRLAKAKLLLFRHPRRSVMSKYDNISSGDPKLDYLSLFRIKDSRILKNVIDSRSKAYQLCSLLCGGNDGVGSRFLNIEIKTILLTLLLILFSAKSFAAPAQNIYNFNTTQQQTQFDNLTQNLRCLVCQNQTLAESNAPLAQDLRAQIFQMIQAQKSDQAIKNYLIQRYGNFVTYTPPFNPSTYILWCLPAALLLLGIFIVRRLSS